MRPEQHSRPAENGAADEAPDDGISPATVPHPDDPAALRRRREASLRMSPLPDGRRDPWDLGRSDGQWPR